MKKLRLLEWNLNGKTGTGVGGSKYSFPVGLITASIKSVGVPDVLVFTEFVSSCDNLAELTRELEKEYIVEKTTPCAKRNGVCIAIKKGYSRDFKKIYEGDGKPEVPDLLAVSDGNITIVGVRRPGESNQHIKYIIDRIKDNKGKTIIIGDFNISSYEKVLCNREIKRYNQEMKKTIEENALDYSIRIQNGPKAHECNGIINQTNSSLLDYVLTTFDVNTKISYRWDFLNILHDNLADTATWLNMRCIPDHAMLLAEFEVN